MRSPIFRHFYSGIITLNFFLTSRIVYIIFLRVDIFFSILFVTAMFIRHTCDFVSFFRLYFYRNKFSLMRTPIRVETLENIKTLSYICSGHQSQLRASTISNKNINSGPSYQLNCWPLSHKQCLAVTISTSCLFI